MTIKHKSTKATKSATALWTLSLSVFLLSSVSAEPFGTNLTLQAALDQGAKNNPRLQAALNQWRGAEENITVQKGLPDPTFTYGYYFESVETRVGPQNQIFGLRQTLPGFGKLTLKKAIATDLATAAEQRYQSEKLALNYRITQAYAELHYLKRSTEITAERIRLFQDLENAARARYETGSPMAPVLQAQLELGRLEEQHASLNDLQQPQMARLNAALNRPATTPLSIPTALPYRLIEADPNILSRSSPELAEMAQHIAAGEHRIQLAKRERLPDFTLGIQYIETGDAAIPMSDSGKDPIIGTVGITLPIWFGKNRAKIESAAYLKMAAQLTLESRTLTLEADIRQILFQLRDADRKLALYQENLIPKALQSLEVSRKGYEAGQLEFINLIDAERILLEFQLSYERARADHLIHRAKLSQLTGIDFLTNKNKSLAGAEKNSALSAPLRGNK